MKAHAVCTSHIAETLTRRPSQVRHELPRLGRLSKASSLNRAHGVLRSIADHIRRMRQKIDPTLLIEIGHIISASDDRQLRQFGLDVEYAELDKVAMALVNGAPMVEVETIGPYA